MYAAHDRKDDVVIAAVGGRSTRYPVVLRHMISPTEVAAVDISRGHTDVGSQTAHQDV